MYNLFLENVAKSQYAERLQQEENIRFRAPTGRHKYKIIAAYLVLATSSVVLMMLFGG